MRKFIVLSAIVGLAGIGIGIADRHSDGPSAAVEAVAEAPSSTTTSAPAPATPVTTARKVTPKAPASTSSTTAAAAKITTTTTTQRTSTTTRPASVQAAPTVTTQTTAAPVSASPTCTVKATEPSISSAAEWQTIQVASNMPKGRIRISVDYPGARDGQLWTATDAAGAASKSFQSPGDPGTARVVINFYDPVTENPIGGSSICETSFEIS